LTVCPNRVLTFRLPITVPAPIVAPSRDAQLTDKLQWLAINRPHTMRRICDQVEAVIALHRPQPAAMLVNLTGQLEYRALTVNDPAALLVPADRLGRNVRDVMPSALLEVFDRTLDRVRKTHQPDSYTFPVKDQMYKGTIYVPSGDTVLVRVSKVV
jgi:hypothetical protein